MLGGGWLIEYIFWPNLLDLGLISKYLLRIKIVSIVPYSDITLASVNLRSSMITFTQLT